MFFRLSLGKFWKADGTLIKDLAVDGPLRPSEADSFIMDWVLRVKKPTALRIRAFQTVRGLAQWLGIKTDIRILLTQFKSLGHL